MASVQPRAQSRRTVQRANAVAHIVTRRPGVLLHQHQCQCHVCGRVCGRTQEPDAPTRDREDGQEDEEVEGPAPRRFGGGT